MEVLALVITAVVQGLVLAWLTWLQREIRQSHRKMNPDEAACWNQIRTDLALVKQSVQTTLEHVQQGRKRQEYLEERLNNHLERHSQGGD